jgi:hypothetical protein
MCGGKDGGKMLDCVSSSIQRIPTIKPKDKFITFL